jgi:hypothetical protein
MCSPLIITSVESLVSSAVLATRHLYVCYRYLRQQDAMFMPNASSSTQGAGALDSHGTAVVSSSVVVACVCLMIQHLS